MTERGRALALFRRSVLKQRKLAEIVALLGPTRRPALSRPRVGQRRGQPAAAAARRPLGVRRPDRRGGGGDPRARRRRTCTAWTGCRCRSRDGEFDRVVVVDMLEHVTDEAAFVAELRAHHAPGRHAGREHAASQDTRAAPAAPRDRPDRRETRPPAPGLHAAERSARAASPAASHSRAHRTYSRFFSELWTPPSTGRVERLGKKWLVEGHGGHGRGRRASTGKLFLAYSRDVPDGVDRLAPGRARARAAATC